jgi:hypothetical protein
MAFLPAIVVRAAGNSVGARVSSIAEPTKAYRAGEPSDKPFKPRVISESPYFDAALLGALEAWILERCPKYGFSRELSGDYRASELYGLILLKDQKEPLPENETRRLRAAANLAPDHPEILRRFAVRMIREGKVQQGVTRLEKVIARYPYFAPAYDALFPACADADIPVPESVLTGNALIACSESADLSLRLAKAFSAKEWHVNAIAAYSLASALAPDNRAASEGLAAATASARR